MKGGLFVLAM
jgi:hypothetical protein